MPDITVKMKDNISEVQVQGVEAEAYYRITEQWYGFLNYTYNDSEIEDDEANPGNIGNRLSHTPVHKLNFGLTYDNPRWLTATLQGRYIDDSYDDNENTTRLDSYWAFDLRLQRLLWEHAILSVDVENIFDEEYDVPSFNTYEHPGRLWAVALTFQF